MTSQRHRIRRVLAIAASACVGLTGALVFAAPASAHHPIVEGSAECDVQTGEWVITWTVDNDWPSAEITKVKVEPQAQLSTIVVGAELPSQGSLTETQRVPGDTEEASLTVAAKWEHKKAPDERSADIQLGGPCKQPPEPMEPTIERTSDCETLTVTVTNPKAAPELNATVTAGDETVDLTIAPGGSGEATFDAEDGTVATVTIGNSTIEVPWEEPANCDEEGGEGGGDEELPETGAPIGLIAGGAVLLLALGGGLYALARRRRYSFTA